MTRSSIMMRPQVPALHQLISNPYKVESKPENTLINYPAANSGVLT